MLEADHRKLQAVGRRVTAKIIDQGSSARPAAELPDRGIRLDRLELTGPASLLAEFSPALELDISLKAAASASICEAIMLNDSRIITQSPLSFRHLDASSIHALN